MSILVTGGAGYIGSHACVELLKANYDLVVLDNLSNSQPEALDRVEQIAKRPITFIEGDIRDRTALQNIFTEHHIEAVMHFAGLKAVGESSEKPGMYYDVNVTGSLRLIEVMEANHCHHIVFSSSATVYGANAPSPYIETLPTSASNVYGRTKLIVEDMLRDHHQKPRSPWRISLLRYFNPIGAHPSGLIGEAPLKGYLTTYYPILHRLPLVN